MTDHTNDSKTQGVPEYGWSRIPSIGIARALVPRIMELVSRQGLGSLSGLRVLDVGCGKGYIGGRLMEAGCDVTGVDPSREGIEISRREFPSGRWEQLAVNDTLIEQLGGEPFDLVVSTEVVEHLYAPRVWARACLGCLRPGGLFCCSTPYHGYLKNLLIGLRGQWDWHLHPLKDGGHIKFWSPHTLNALLDEAGFGRIGWEGVGRMPYLWKSMLMHGRRPDE